MDGLANVPTRFWVIFGIISIGATVIAAAAPPFLAGAISGAYMRGLTVKRGLWRGAWVAVPMVVINLVASVIPISGGWWNGLVPWAFLLVGISATIWLCRRESQKRDTP